MNRSFTRYTAESNRTTSRLRQALHWDARLPRPLLVLLLLDLLLLLPIPFLLPGLFAPPVTPVGAIADQPLPPLTPLLVAPAPTPLPAVPRSASDPAAPMPLLIDPLRLQSAPTTDANTVAAVLAQYAPQLAALQFDVGGVQQSLANVITGQALRWNINPQVLLVLLETQNKLLSTALPSSATLDAALRGPTDLRGLDAQLMWAALELRAGLLEPISPTVTLIDGSAYTITAVLDQPNYALVRLLARTHSRAELELLLGDGVDSWAALARPIMGDPRSPVRNVVRDGPFLHLPFTSGQPIARFDHQYPLVQKDGQMLGDQYTAALGYDGHNAWDFLLPADAPVLAAADGQVLFAGWIDSGCATAAGVVYVQHANGYLTSYWHLSRIDVAAGDTVRSGTQLGIVGASGCARDVHLHFGVQRLGRDVDPFGWCSAEPDPWALHPAGAPSRWLWLDSTNPCPLPANAIIADDSDPATALLQGAGWNSAAAGNARGSRWVAADGADATMVWRPALPAAGRYRVYVFLPNTATAGAHASYTVAHADGTSTMYLDQAAHAGSWATLGAFRFLAGQSGYVQLQATAAAPPTVLWFDAVAWVPEDRPTNGD